MECNTSLPTFAHYIIKWFHESILLAIQFLSLNKKNANIKHTSFYDGKVQVI